VNPITFSDDDRLFVAQCFLGTNLYELDPAGEREPRLISDTLGPGCGLNGMDWGPDGRLYGPRWFAGEVVSFDVDDNSMRVEASGFQTPAAVKFNSRGELHVLDTARGEVIKVDAGEKQTVATVGIGLDNFAFDARDRLFVSSFTDGYVRRVDADGSVTELQPGGLCHAGGAAIMGNNVVLADLHGIRGYDLESGELAFTQRNIVGVSEIGGAFNVALDGDNLILVSWFDGDVRIWDPVNEKRVARYPDLVLPVAAVRYGDAIAVAEHGKSRVVAFSNEGAETTLASGLPAPTGLVVEGGNLYVSDRTLGQILLIASGGKALPEPRVIVANLTTPEGFVVTENGFVIVEADLGHVTAVDSAGQRQVLAEIPPGTQAFAEAYPPSQIFNGIAVAPDGRLYVPGETDRSLYRISY
jgi:sugar lactone lactonase YvrE